MSYNPPVFNLLAYLWRWATWTGTVPPGVPEDDSVPAQLRMLKTANMTSPIGNPSSPKMAINFPALTDVRGGNDFGSTAGNPDLIEIPAGSGRYYRALWVDDVAKGFSNEYRMVVAVQLVAPTPLP